MPQETVVMNGGESPLASKSQAGAETTSQLQAGANQMDGGPAPGGMGETQPAALRFSEESSGLANNGGIMRPQ